MGLLCKHSCDAGSERVTHHGRAASNEVERGFGIGEITSKIVRRGAVGMTVAPEIQSPDLMRAGERGAFAFLKSAVLDHAWTDRYLENLRKLGFRFSRCALMPSRDSSVS